MRGCLFTLALGAVLLALLVVVGLPAVAEGLLTAGLTAGGLQSDDTTVTVRSDPPTDLVGMHADHVRVLATDATFRDLEIGRLDVNLGDVAILARTAGTIEGTLTDVAVPLEGGSLTLDEIAIQGDDEHITATTVVPGAQVKALMTHAIEEQTGVRPSSVTLTSPDRVAIKTSVGLEVQGRLAVTEAGDLVVRAEGPLAGQDIVLLQGGGPLPIQLTGVRVTPAGALRLTGDLAISLLG
jgi:hypothetical protein